MWASKAAHFGYSCRVGKGTKVKFWEDQWFDNSSLAIRYWELYNIVNEKKIVIAHVWDGYNLKYDDKGMQIIIKKKECVIEIVGFSELLYFGGEGTVLGCSFPRVPSDALVQNPLSLDGKLDHNCNG